MGTVAKLKERYSKLESDKSILLSDLQEIAEYFQPDKASFFGTLAKDSQDRINLFDSTSEEALELLAAALQTLLTSPVHSWFALEIALMDEELSDEAKDWLEMAQEKMLAKFNNEESGFHSAVHEFDMDLPSFGTAAFYVDEHDGIRFCTIPLNEICVSENSKNVIDTVFRSFEMTARQICEKWPKGASHEAKEALEKDPDRKMRVIHAVYPRDNAVEGSKKSKELPIASVYFEYQSHKILNESGFYEMPYMVARWSKASGMVYGRGPGHKSMPDVRVVNEMSKSEMIAVDKASDPLTILPHDGFLNEFDSSGGSTNYHRSTGDIREKIMTLGSDADLNAIRTAIAAKQDSIRRKFLNDKLQMVGGPAMTATEVIAVQNEKMRILGPVLGRLQQEWLAPLIYRVFSIMIRNGEIPPAPEEIQDAETRVRYVSPISRAQKQTDAEALTQAMQYLQPAVAVNPQILRNFDFDEIARDTQKLFGYSAKYLKSPDKIKKEEEAQQKAAQEQQALMKTQQELEVAKSQKELNSEPAA